VKLHENDLNRERELMKQLEEDK